MITARSSSGFTDWQGWKNHNRKLNILFINSIQMFGGGEVWLLTTMAELRRRGHRVTLICRPYTELAHRAQQQGFDLITLKMRGDFDPLIIFKVFRILKTKRIQLLCTNMDKELRFGGLAARLAGLKAIIPRRGIDYPLKNKWRYRLAYMLLASRIIANSQATKQALLTNAPWLPPNKIEVIYNGIDLAPFLSPGKKDIRSELKIPKQVSLIGFVGQLDERKGLVYLLEAFEILVKELPQVQLLLVGQGALRNFIEKTVIEKNFQEKIHLLGFREEIPDIMKALDVLVLPSLWEGFGIVLIEAMAAGKPVVTTNVSSMPEIVSHGQTGFLVTPANSVSLAQALMTILRDKTLAQTMGAEGRRMVQERFTLKRMIDHYERVFYEELKRNSQ
ncbi:MAG: glycosyltransferase family 4 protein [candidate division KSB1 bacterium]|nr:glycosyltransferase family 4 protein [candidate division KSB1 bacterium]